MKDSKQKGWVRLHRKIEDNPIWFMESFTKAQAWVDLFLNANHKDSKICIRGNILDLKRGQIGWSELTMCKRWRWSKGKVRRYLSWLESVQQIVQQKDRYITTIITILKYDEHQEDGKTVQQTVKQTDSRQYIDKNVKNVKNDKKEVFSFKGYKDYMTLKGYKEDKYDLRGIYEQMQNWIEANPDRTPKVWKNFALNWIKKIEPNKNKDWQYV